MPRARSPRRRAPRRAWRRCRRCRPRRAAPAARSSGRGTVRPPAAGGLHQRATPVSHSTSAGIPKPTASTSGAAARTSSTASEKDVERLLNGPPRATPAGPGDAPPAPRPPRRRGASSHPRRSRSRASVAWRVGYTEGGERPSPAPRSTTSTLARRSRSGAVATSTPSSWRLVPSPRRRRAAAPARAALRSPPAAWVKWVALAVAAWLLLSLILFLISAQTSRASRPRPRRAPSRGGTLLTGSTILVLGSDALPASRSTRAPVGTRLGRTRSCSCTPSLRERAQAVDPARRRDEIPGHGARQDQRRLRVGGPALTIRDGGGVPRNGLEINHLVEVDFADFPAFIDSLGGITVDSKSRICSPPFDNFWKGIRFKKGRERAGRLAARSASPASARTLRPGRGRPRPRRPASRR